jgi:uncharacterized protein
MKSLSSSVLIYYNQKALIPLFPNFKNLELNDKEEFENFTKKFEPFSDYNFLSLWAYNTEKDTRISILSNNLVLRFRDYITNEPFYSFLGKDEALNTINELLELSKKEGFKEELKLIPEANIEALSDSDYLNILEDRDSFDYILSIDDLSQLNGDKFHTHKNFVNRFNKTHGSCHLATLNLLDPVIHDQILNVFYTWELKRKKSRDETVHELSAIQRILRDANKFNNITLGVYDREILIGFIIASLEQMDYAISHFAKADMDYQGIFYFMYHNLAIELKEYGYKYLNNEQDMGIPGLRKSKEQWNPSHYLKKYIITKKT